MVGFRAILEIGVQHTFPQKWPLSGSVDDRPQMAGVVRSRTAASWQRNSQKATVPQRRLRGSLDARSGSVVPVDRMEKPPFAVAWGRTAGDRQIAAWLHPSSHRKRKRQEVRSTAGRTCNRRYSRHEGAGASGFRRLNLRIMIFSMVNRIFLRSTAAASGIRSNVPWS